MISIIIKLWKSVLKKNHCPYVGGTKMKVSSEIFAAFTKLNSFVYKKKFVLRARLTK